MRLHRRAWGFAAASVSAVPALALSCTLGLTSPPRAWFSPPIEKSSDQLVLEKAFHIVGVPGVKRNRRVDVIFTSQSLQVKSGTEERLSVPYARIRRLQVLFGTRDYAKATYAAVLAGGVGGVLLLAKKQHVDTLVFDYLNERGGEMGMIIQVPAGKGVACGDWLRRFGVVVEQPEPLPPSPTGGLPR